MDANIIKEFVSKVKLFSEFTEEELFEISKFMKLKYLEKDTLLFSENTARNHVYIIYDGEVELFQRNPFGQETRLSFFSKYDFLGEGSLIDDSPHSTSARALLKTKVISINRAQVEELMKDNGTMAIKLYSKIAEVISRRLRRTNSRATNVGAQYDSGRTRIEHDLLGERNVPEGKYYGIQTLRALENFNISGQPINTFPNIVFAFGMVKMAAAKANFDLGLLSKPVADAIIQACNEVVNGKLQTSFVVDMIQGGAGTSTNMNANEVIANRALEFLDRDKGDYKYCHPNNHVNLSQSTNDAYPTAMKLALIKSNESLIFVLKELITSFRNKGKEFANIIKMGRTQLQDAVPMTLGQEFESYAVTLEEEVRRLEQNANLFLEINMGATAIGTGINAPEGYSQKCVEYLKEISGYDVVLASNLVEATQDTGAFVIYSSALKRLAVKLSKISNDLRLLSSGPRTGLNEINLPPMQPGSSIMPGKVNPVIPEVVNQIAFKVIGNDLTVTLGAEAGQLELNVMEPVIAQSILESISMLSNGMNILKFKCVDGITANEERCNDLVKNSIGLITALNPVLGYEKSTQIAKEALEKNLSLYDLVLEKGLISKEELEKLLAPKNMVGKI